MKLRNYEEAAQELGVSIAWLKKQVHLGEVPYRKLGQLVRFSDSDLDAIANRDARTPKTKARGRK